MSQQLPAQEPDDLAESNSGLPAAIPRRRKKRLIILTVAFLCLIGAGGFMKWSAGRETQRTDAIASALASEGVVMHYAEAVAAEGGLSFALSGQMTTIVRVHSQNHNITDQMLRQIADINTDLYLVLNRCPVTDSGLAVLTGKHNVRWLQLRATKIGNEGVARLAGLNLESLDLSGTKIDDEGLTTLCQFDFPRLNDLSLEGTKITDTGAAHLARYKSLEWLALQGTKVTLKGRQQLKEVLPDLSFVSN